MVDGWLPKKNNWLLLHDGDKVLGSVTFMGTDDRGLNRYRPVSAEGTLLLDGAPQPGLRAVQKIVEQHAGVDNAIPDLRTVGVVNTFKIRCAGGCGLYLNGAQEWLDVREALRAARSAGWLQARPDAPRNGRYTVCPLCRKLSQETL
ncbi:hypothetical protein ACFZAM_32050 [Streptomyces sp. NPDC008079]|uniref:hypothetical protein n=1 Tax=Streptomyces sp. NPDC008079 TaxID=3364806 RepID=UPI0036E5846A